MAHFVVVGGTVAEIAKLRKVVRRRSVESSFTLLPAVSTSEARRFQRMANVLVTCRTRGTNTPLKVYHYLNAGKPIVATAIRSHTQVLDADTAELVEPDAPSIAAGIVRVLRDADRARSLTSAASQLARTRYNPAEVVPRLASFLDRVAARNSFSLR
jgi:glycosyltransferase involved in cell wall biosynthesis